MTRPPPPVPDTLARELRSLFGADRRRLWEHSDTADLTPSQIAAVLRLEEMETATTSDLARAEGMRPQSMRAIVAALETAGMIAQAPDPQDGRKTRLTLSDRCRAWLREGRARRQDWLVQRIETRLDADEQAQLAAILPALRRVMES